MVGWHYRLDGHEFEQTRGDGEGQGSLACCSPRGCKGLSNLMDILNITEIQKDSFPSRIKCMEIHAI